MRVLITGARGQLGRELVEEFQNPGHHQVLPVGREQLDCTSLDDVLGCVSAFGPELIVNASAYTAVDDCESHVDEAFAVNALAVRNLVQGAELVGGRVLHVSTDYVFDGESDRPYNEWDQTNPQSVYGRSKRGGELELRNCDVVVRTSWVFGRHGKNIVKTILRASQSVPELSFVDDQFGNPTAAHDLAAAIYQLAVKRDVGVFHLTNQGSVSWWEFARDVLALAGEDPERVKPIKTADLQPPRPAKRPHNSVLDNAAWRLSGRAPLRHYREPLGEVVKALLAEGV